MQKKALIIIGIVVLLAIILGGAFLWIQKSQTPMTNVRSNTNVQTLNTQTDDWKTYVDKRNGFEVKYPQDWQGGSADYNPKAYIIDHDNGLSTHSYIVIQNLKDQNISETSIDKLFSE
jgi:FtsZ-interacting cell division protein ZipA